MKLVPISFIGKLTKFPLQILNVHANTNDWMMARVLRCLGIDARPFLVPPPQVPSFDEHGFVLAQRMSNRTEWNLTLTASLWTRCNPCDQNT
jgi:hypothetical protein